MMMMINWVLSYILSVEFEYCFDVNVWEYEDYYIIRGL